MSKLQIDVAPSGFYMKILNLILIFVPFQLIETGFYEYATRGIFNKPTDMSITDMRSLTFNILLD